MIWFVLNALTCSLNVALFAWHGRPLNLGAAVFSGLVAVYFGAKVVAGRD